MKLLSIIIPVGNEAGHIAAKLQALQPAESLSGAASDCLAID